MKNLLIGTLLSLGLTQMSFGAQKTHRDCDCCENCDCDCDCCKDGDCDCDNCDCDCCENENCDCDCCHKDEAKSDTEAEDLAIQMAALNLA